MNVYAISLEKGGTGKSSIAVNLAVALVQQGQRVLLIDLDAQGHASRWLGVDPETLSTWIAAFLVLSADARRRSVRLRRMRG
ncbi:MAG: ParA family protein [Chloroflexaceae bacterium]|nr:ParA family protein [Chloroflexaceae bacterium]